MAAPSMPDPPRTLADPQLRRGLVAAVQRRVPPDEVDDIVQATLVEALAAPSPPADEEGLRKWVYGIARNKVVDFHRQRGRHVSEGDPEEVAADSGRAQHDAADLLRWAEREAPPADANARTLDWMLREGDGEKLEDIARAESLPAPQVRQRVARLRKHFRARWAIAIAATLGALVVLLLLTRKTAPEEAKVLPSISADPSADLRPKAAALRTIALARCAEHAWAECLRGLDEAAKLDPIGDGAPAVREARAAAERALAPAPSQSVVPTPVPAPKPTVAPELPELPEGKAPPPQKKQSKSGK